jgi:hypothetical protein
MNGITPQLQPDDTVVTALNRIINSGDYREPVSQYLAAIIKKFIVGDGTIGPPGPQGPPGPPAIILVADRNAVLAYPQSLGILLQTQSDGKLYQVENFQWMEITNKPA